jgi:S-DNA-T family DNA segregation ATPase FtsK/SpoIIIE
MTTSLGNLMTTPNEQNGDGSKPGGGDGQAHDRDVQRHALRELVELSTQCATDEAEIEQRHDRDLAAEADDFEKKNYGAEHRAKQMEEAVRQKYEDRVGKVQAQFDAETASIREGHEQNKRKVQAQYGPVEQDVKKKYDEAVWLADAELEARQNQVRVEERQANDDLKAHGEEIDDLEGRAIGVLKKYRHKPSDQDASLMATPEGQKPEPGNFAARREAASKELHVLESLFVPRLFVGAKPFLLLFVLLAIAGGATFALHMNDTAKAYDPMTYAIPVGGTLIAAIVIGVLARVIAKGSIRKAWTRCKKHLNEAREAAKVDHANALKQLEERGEAAKQKRANEVAQLKTKYNPMLAQATQKKKAALAVLEQQYAAKVKGFEEKRKALLVEQDAWRDRHLADVKTKLAAELAANKQKHEARVAQIEETYRTDKAALADRWKDGLARISAPMQDGANGNGRTVYDWEGTDWHKWKAPRTFSPTVRFGEFQVDLKTITDKYPRHLPLPEAFAVPANLAFPKGSSLLIHSDREGRPDAVATMQMVMARLLTTLPPGRVKFTIIDPVGLGQNFAGFMHLADHDESLVGGRIWTEREQIDQRLLNLTEHMETVIQKYLRNEYETIDAYNEQAGELAEPYRYLVIADFPVGFEGDAFRRLASIATSGARCGVYVLMIRDTRVPMPQGSHFDDIEAHSVNLVRVDGKYVWKDEVFKRFPLKLDGPPSEETLTDMMDVVGREAKTASRVEVPFWQIAPKDVSEYWTKTAKKVLDVPVGRLGATKVQSLRMGIGVAQHALVAGKTGSGKSTLLHAMVTNIAMWYRPDEVELYLIDFKKGVEFKTYAANELPHARAIAVESDREFGLSVLQRLDAELTRRGEIFRKLGVQNLTDYREAPGTGPMPRTLLVIDEFQEFFSEDDKLAQDAALLIDRLVRQGRAFGIHVFLGSQTIGGSGGLGRATLTQMAIRIALMTSEADSQLILGDGNSAARLLSRPGEAIYNDQGGLVEANSPFQVAWLPDEQRDEFLKNVLKKTREQNAFYGEPAVVFEGNAPADFTKNRLLIRLLDNPPKQQPLAPVAWMGDPVAIKDPSGTIMRRQSGANVLIIGQADEQAMSIMVSQMISLSAQHPKGTAKFYVMDGTPADSPLAGTFERIKEIIPHEVNIVDYKGVEAAMTELAEEQARRAGLDAPDYPEVYVLIYGLQRYRQLRKSEDSFSFGGDEEKKPAADTQFGDLVREGPNVGMHIITWCDTPASVERTLDRQQMREFDNRVLFQMSANDSSNLIDSPAANKLGMFRALVFSEEQGVMEKFRPYGLGDRAWFEFLKSKFAKYA